MVAAPSFTYLHQSGPGSIRFELDVTLRVKATLNLPWFFFPFDLVSGSTSVKFSEGCMMTNLTCRRLDQHVWGRARRISADRPDKDRTGPAGAAVPSLVPAQPLGAAAQRLPAITRLFDVPDLPTLAAIPAHDICAS